MSSLPARSYGAVWMLLALYVVIGALSCTPGALSETAYDALALTREGVLAGQVWRLATYPFLAGSPISLLFSVLVFYYIAAPLESAWGTRRFVMLFLFSVVGGGLTAVALDRPLANDWAVIVTLMLIHGFLFPESLIYLFLVIPIRVKTLALLSTAGFLVVCILQGLAGLAWFAGLLCGVLYYVFVTGRLPPIVRFRKKVRAVVTHPVETARDLSNAQLMEQARRIMRRRDSGQPPTAQDRAFIEEFIARADPDETICSQYSFSPDNTICPPCRQFGRCLKRYLETEDEETGKKTG